MNLWRNNGDTAMGEENHGESIYGSWERPSDPGDGSSGDADVDINRIVKQPKGLLDLSPYSEENGGSLDQFRKDLGEIWDTLSPEQQAGILNEFPELMGGQSQG